MSSLLKTDVIANSFVILFHFLNLTAGMIALFIILNRVSFVSPRIQRSFFLQAMFYNLVVIFSAATDFLDFFFWKIVSTNIVTLSFLYLMNISALAMYVLWALFFAQMVNNFLGSQNDLWEKNSTKIIIIGILIFLVFLFITRVIRIIPSLYMISSLFFIFSILGVILSYSILVNRKAHSESNAERRNALKVFSRMFIAFSVMDILVFLNFYPLKFLPDIVTKFSYNIMDLLFNSLVILWGIKYLDYLNTSEEPIAVEKVSIDATVQKYQISKRELDVINLVCAGKSNQEIADSLFISLGTVKNHLYNVYSKIGIKNRTQLAKLFQSQGR